MLFEAAGGRATGVIDDDVQAAESLYRLRHKTANIVGAGHVAGNRQHVDAGRRSYLRRCLF